MLCISLLSSCTNSDSETYKYCIYSAERLCAEGPFATCQENGKLSNTCSYDLSSSPSGVSSSSSIPRSSSSVDGNSSSVVVSSSSVTVPSSSSVSLSSGMFKDDRDGTTYKYVVIGKQTWMAENSNYEVKDSKCIDNVPANCDKYGRLYYWDMAEKACPSGWHLPSDAEWQILVDFAGGENIAGEKLKAKRGWEDYEGKSGNGTDNFGFAALPGGYGYFDGSFRGYGSIGFWWGSNVIESSSRYINNSSATVFRYGYGGQYHWRSVRCLQD